MKYTTWVSKILILGIAANTLLSPAVVEGKSLNSEKVNTAISSAVTGTSSVAYQKNLGNNSDISRIVLLPAKTTLSLGDQTTLLLQGILTDGTSIDLTLGEVTYKSSDTSILKVDRINNKIFLTALNTGETYVMASTNINGILKTASAKIVIYKNLNSKTRSTYYTIAKVEAARSNVKKYPWAKKLKDDAVTKANKYLTLGNDAIWNLVTPQGLPRSYAVNQDFGCPNCGKKIDAYGHYPYILNAINNPWKLECPSCHLKFPTNDFNAYYKSGKDRYGNFNPKLANKSLLVNKLYPEKGSKWGVDDGFGYKDSSGKKYTFIAYYNHWALWRNGIITNALNSLRDAYIYTGDSHYSRAGIILLDRIADVYPSMNISAYKPSDGFLNSDGGSNLGKVLGSIWETDLAKDLLKAYDAFFPAFDDPTLVTFLNNKAKFYSIKTLKRNQAEIKKNIEDNIVNQIFPAVKAARIKGNNGMHQSTLALAAIVLDTLPQTRQMIDFDFQAGYSSKTKVTGGNILANLVNDVDRDGQGSDIAPQYNKLFLSQYLEVADILEGYDLYPAADLYKNVKFRKMFSAMYPLILTDIYSALIGDSGSTGSPTNYLDMPQYVTAFDQFGDSVLAQIIYYLNGNKIDNIHSDVFSFDPEKIAMDIKKVIDTYGTLKLNSTNLTGYGFAALRDGRAKINFEQSGKPSEINSNSITDTQRTLWMYYGNNQGHGHFDTLNLGINAFKLDLTPELGYPEYADESANRMEWVRNTISHNTVVVDNSRQQTQTVSQPKHFDDSSIVKLIDVESPNSYSKTSLYKRTSAMIRVDDVNSYVVDFFRINGGKDHYFSFHGAEGSVQTEGLSLKPQVDFNGLPIGTYAGPDVAFGIRPDNDSVPGFGYLGGGFHWLTGVEKDTEAKDFFSVDWKARDTWNVYRRGMGADTDIHLRLTMLGKVNDVSLADGIPPQNKGGNPKSLRYMIAHRHGDENLNSVFTSVLEPYQTNRFVTSIAPVSLKLNGLPVADEIAKAVKVTLKDGRTDYIINSINPDYTYLVDDKYNFKGFFGVLSERNGKEVYSYLNDGTIIGNQIINAVPKVTGIILDFNRDMNINNEITLKVDNSNIKDSDLIGKYIYIENDGIRNASYQIKDIKSRNGDQLTLDIGDITPIRSFKDINDFSKGYVYDINAGARFAIPLSYSWKQ